MIELNKSQLVYTLLGDGGFSEELSTCLLQNSYDVRHFNSLSAIKSSCDENKPAIIIVDVEFEDDNLSGIHAVARLNNDIELCASVIYVSSSNDSESRLKSVRAGADRYFFKPASMDELLHTIQGLCVKLNHKAYRVLIIDDDVPLLESFSSILNESNIVVESISDPMKSLEMIDKFKPDVIVIDLHTPFCSATELLHMIRQDDRWATIPILFLSSEQDVNNQLETMPFETDVFLAKPVPASKLVAVVNSMAKHARKYIKLNADLKNSLRENKLQTFALDQHAVVSSADIEGDILEVNDKLCEISGYSRAELIGQNHRKLKSDFHDSSFYKNLWETISNGNVWHGVICNKAKNGNEYWVDSTIVPFLDETGKPYKYVSVRTDVTNLRESEYRLKRSQEAANMGSWDWNIGTDDLYWSDHIWPIFGYKKEELSVSYDNFLKALHPDDKEKVEKAIENCIEHAEDYSIEHRIVWPDKSIHWVHESGNVVCNNKGEPKHMLGLVQNIDSRKRSEFTLAESKQTLLEAQKLAKVGNWHADIVKGELIWSDEIYRIFGHEPGSFAPSVEAFHAAVHPDDREKVLISEKEAEQTGLHDIVHRIIRPDGSVHYVHELAKAETDDTGKLIKLSGTVQDVTDLVQAENKQRGNNEILELIVHGKPLKDILASLILHAETMLPNAMCSVLLLDQSGKYLSDSISPGLPDFYNDAIDGLEIGMGVGSCGEAAFSGKRLIADDLMTHPNWVAFRELAKKAGLRACWSEPFSSSSGVVLGTFAIYFPEPKLPNSSEINLLIELAQFAAIAVERHRSQNALMSAKEEAESASYAKSQFLSSMSHELRTPMNAIMGFSQILKIASPPLTDVQEGNVNEILAASTHLMSLINEILDLAKIESGHFELSVAKVNLNEIIKEPMCLILPSAQKRGIEIELLKDGTEVSIENLTEQEEFVWLDETRFKQIILNLMSNAVKYNNEKGKVTFTCDKIENNFFRICITDTGKGISKEQQKDLFKSFNRLGLEQTNVEGSGIGLVITKKLVEIMGGKIGFNSEVGIGSTFWIELPIKDKLVTKI